MTYLNEEDRVVIFDPEPDEETGQEGIATYVLYDVLGPNDGEDATPFLEEFDIDPTKYVHPNTDFYQGVEFVRVITRKSDGRKFGYQYWADISKYGEAYPESNGEEHGFEWDEERGEAWVWLPVEPSTNPTYVFESEGNGEG